MIEPIGGETTDAELIQRWKGGDQRAATTLVERHSPALARFAVSQGARHDIDELVQDTFVRAFNSIDGFRGESSFRTWLLTIERRLLLDRRRSEKRRPDKVEIQEGDASTQFDALDGMVADEAGGILAAGGGRDVVQGNRGRGRHDGGRGASALSQRDESGEGVSR